MKLLLAFIFLISTTLLFSQKDTSHIIKIWFLYGSRPKYKYRKTEPRYFGGIHSGHVSIQLGDHDYGFQPVQRPVHIFPRKHCDKCAFVDTLIYKKSRHRVDDKTALVIIPVGSQQYAKLDSILRSYAADVPYDYAVFGMRCSSSAQDVLGQAGIVKKKNRFLNIISTFYPKRMRKRVFKLAKKNNYPIVKTEGRKTRVWERD